MQIWLFNALVSFCAIIGLSLVAESVQSERYDYNSAKYAISAKEHATQTCRNLSPSATFDCVYDNVTRAIEHNRAEQDLDAQKSMALWAGPMFIATLISLGIAGAWVWFVRQTLEATLEAVADTSKATRAMQKANKIAADAQRPWISIEAELLSFDIDSDNILTSDCKVTFTNTGQMVAENFYSKLRYVSIPHPFLPNTTKIFDAFYADCKEQDTVVIPGETYEHFIRTNTVIDSFPWRNEGSYREDCYLMVLAMARYRLPGERTWRVAMKGFSIGENKSPVDNRHLIKATISTMCLDSLVLKPLGVSRAT